MDQSNDAVKAEFIEAVRSGRFAAWLEILLEWVGNGSSWGGEGIADVLRQIRQASEDAVSDKQFAHSLSLLEFSRRRARAGRVIWAGPSSGHLVEFLSANTRSQVEYFHDAVTPSVRIARELLGWFHDQRSEDDASSA